MLSHFKLICKPGLKKKREKDAKRLSKWRIDEMVDNTEDNDLSVGVHKKVTNVTIKRENGALGLTLRGGYTKGEPTSEILITNIKTGGAVAKEGTIKVGDRLLAVDGISLEGRSLNEAQTLLKKTSSTTELTVEYNVKLPQSLQRPTTVEIQRDGEELGLTLHHTPNGIVIEHIKEGSLADRCGGLQEGDRILSLNGRADHSLTKDELVQILHQNCPLSVEIAPKNVNFGTLSRNFGTLRGNPNVIYGSSVAITHSETLDTSLYAPGGCFGIVLGENEDGIVIINGIVPDSSAERSQCLYPGDRVLKINHHSIIGENFSPEQAAALIMGDVLVLHTEFDVLDTVVPSNGVFTIKLLKKGLGGLGLTIAGSTDNGFLICDIKKGSLAHRAGSLLPGDRLIAINNITLDTCSSESIGQVLQHVDGLITLTIQRSLHQLQDPVLSRKIVFTVDLQRYGGPLGITLAGSEGFHTPITVSNLVPGGLAEQTGVLHVGDEILAVNDHNVQNEALSTVDALLQTSPDLVTLRISRIIPSMNRPPDSTSPVLPPSVDSAVESWESSHLDLTQPSQDNGDYVRMQSQKNDSEPRESCLIQDFRNMEMSSLPDSREWYRTLHLAAEPTSTYLQSEFQDSHLINVKLHKDKIYDDFGFSVSDGLYERGVFINRIRKGGPADLSRLLMPYDRILQVNETCTKDFDCCLTVPLIASSGDHLSLLVSRSTKKIPKEPLYGSQFLSHDAHQKIIV